MEYNIRTVREQEFVRITHIVRNMVQNKNMKDGVAVVFVPHTTAGLTINESADPNVVIDILSSLNKNFPVKDNYLHLEGNSHAHIKASIMGSSVSVIIENGMLKLGIWQEIYFCEFDGPRNRKIFIKLIE
ncbi:MAG TPA: secondary thiamine-phosphate synthase enzyme YjbQ [Oscillospiraceae bacterium]|nr:secondary thiamine-phosphate synthase enzyme YjbQ [Oscillospiraceae bacterium]